MDGLQAELGERPPLPQPFDGKLTPACNAQRIDSLLGFLAGMEKVDRRWRGLHPVGTRTAPVDASTGAPKRCSSPSGCVAANSFRLWLSDAAALLVFDLGDGDVTTDDVSWAMTAARGVRSELPAQREGDAVGMGYHNTTDPRFFSYDHPDQLAVKEFLTSHNLDLPGGQYVRTYPDDPAVAVTKTVDASVFGAAVAVSPAPDDPVSNPDALRVGALQVDYGWLAFPNAYWYAEQTPVHSFYSQQQTFSKPF